MRILVPTTWYPTADDPVRAVFVRRHVEALALRHEVEVVVLSPGAPAPVDEPGLRVRHVPAPPGSPAAVAGAARELRRTTARLRPDVVHTMGFSSLPFGRLRTDRTPWVHTEHWSGVTHPASAGPVWARAASARHLLRLPRRVTVVSHDMARRVRPFVRAGAVDVVGNVVEQVRPTPRPGGAGLRLLAIGALVDVKDPLLAVRTVAALRDAGADVVLRWAGAGPLDTATREEAARLGVADRVELLGRVDPADLDEQLAWCTGFLLPTRHETFCVAAAEALAHGRPVVVGGVGGQRDFVTPEVGALVDERTPEAYAAAVLETHERLAATPPETFAAAVEAFEPGAVADAFTTVYRRAGVRGA